MRFEVIDPIFWNTIWNKYKGFMFSENENNAIKNECVFELLMHITHIRMVKFYWLDFDSRKIYRDGLIFWFNNFWLDYGPIQRVIYWNFEINKEKNMICIRKINISFVQTYRVTTTIRCINFILNAIKSWKSIRRQTNLGSLASAEMHRND